MDPSISNHHLIDKYIGQLETALNTLDAKVGVKGLTFNPKSGKYEWSLRRASQNLGKVQPDKSFLESLEKLNDMAKDVYSMIEKMSFSSDSPELVHLRSRFNVLSTMIEGKGKTAIHSITKELSKENDKKDVNNKASNLFATIISVQGILQDKSVNSQLDTNPVISGQLQANARMSVGMGQIQLEEARPHKKSDAQALAQTLIDRSSVYREHLKEVTNDPIKGVIIPQSVVDDSVEDMRLKEKIPPDAVKEDLKRLNNDSGNYRNLAPVDGWNSLAITDILGKTTIVENAVTPTSQREKNNPASNHLTNIKYQIQEDSHLTISCGGIDSLAKANEFVTGLLHSLEKMAPGATPRPLRLMMHQLNSFATDGGLVIQQNYWSRYIESKLQTVLSDPAYSKSLGILYKPNEPIVVHVNTATNMATIMPGEDESSRAQNIDGWLGVAAWTIDTIGQNPMLQNSDFRLKKENLIEIKNKIGEVKLKISAAPAAAFQAELKELQEKGKEELKGLIATLKKWNDQTKLPDFDDPNFYAVLSCKDQIELFSIVIANQIQATKEFKLPLVSRNTEIELHLLMDMMLGSVTEINCLSGLDRTGFVRALWTGLNSFSDSLRKENEGISEEIVFHNLLHFVTHLDEYTNDLDAIQTSLIKEKNLEFANDLTQLPNISPNADYSQKLFDKINDDFAKNPAKYPDGYQTVINLMKTHQYQHAVAAHLMRVGMDATAVSTGAAGLKYGHDNTGMQRIGANPHPLSRIPMFVTLNDKLIRLYNLSGWVNQFGHSMTPSGLELLLRNSRLRGD